MAERDEDGRGGGTDSRSPEPLDGGFEGDLWLDRFARLLGFGWLAERLPGEVPPSYVYAAVTVVGVTAALDGYALLRGTPLVYGENPYFLLLPVGLLGATYGARSLRGAYARVMTEMNVERRAENPTALVEPVPAWLPWVLFVGGAGLQLVRATLALDAYGPTDVVANFVVFPFVYTPILAGFFSVYLGIELFAPRRLAASEVGIHFLDPEGVGGLRPLGELVKTAYYYVVVGLVGGALITYAPLVDSGWQVIPFANLLFTGVWVASVATVAYAVFTLHRFMYREKRREKRRLEAELLDIVEEPWDVAAYEIPENRREEVEDIRNRMKQISATSEYPATFSIWSKLVLSVVLPKAVQLLLEGP